MFFASTSEWQGEVSLLVHCRGIARVCFECMYSSAACIFNRGER